MIDKNAFIAISAAATAVVYGAIGLVSSLEDNKQQRKAAKRSQEMQNDVHSIHDTLRSLGRSMKPRANI